MFSSRAASSSALPSPAQAPASRELLRNRPPADALLPEARGLAVTPQRASLRRPPQAS